MASADSKIEDNICPICLYIFIQPVTMPCEHELCLACFRQNVEEANFCCPMCRIRISTWARRAARNKTLVNEKRWKFIQEKFPEQVKNRLDGKEEEDEEMQALNVSIRLAEPGEIRTEYEQQLKQLQEQRLEERKKELEASERLISQLQEEERKKRAELEQIAIQDEELARKLSENDVNSPLGIDQRLRGSRGSSYEDMQRSNSERSRSNCESIETFINTLRSENNMSKSPYPYRCLTPVGTGKLCVDKDKVAKMEEKFHQQKIKCDRNLITTQDIANLEEHFKSNRTRAASNTEVIEIDHLSRGSESNMSMGMTHVVSSSSLNQSEILDQMSSSLSVSVNILDSNQDSSDLVVISPSPQLMEVTNPPLDRQTSARASRSSSSTLSAKSGLNEGQERSGSAQSSDSISQELTHFRPIRSCPLTPPRKLPSGKIVEPQLIRTTPRNLNKSGLGSPIEPNLSDIDAGSPIMQRRLSELAEERKDKVLQMSKCTSTVGTNEENRNPQLSDSSTHNPIFRRTSSSCRSVEFKDISNSPINTKRKLNVDEMKDSTAKKKLIIPLVPDLDEMYIDDSQIDISRNITHKYSKDRLSKSKKGNTGKVRYTSGGKSDVDFSPQLSIVKWMKRNDDVEKCVKNEKSDFLIDSCRDEVDGDKKNEKDLKNTKKTKRAEHSNLSTVHAHGKNKANTDGDKKRVSVRKKSCRNRKSVLKDDFIYDKSIFSSKEYATKLDENESSCDGFCSDGDSEVSEISLVSCPQRKRRKLDSDIQVKSLKKDNVHEPKFKPKPVLKTTKQSKRASRRTVGSKLQSNKKQMKTMRDYFSSDSKEFMQVKRLETQEDIDRKMAEELQKQFEFEAKHQLNLIRWKGTSDEYLFRSKRGSKKVSV